jgi:hypothetical protein
MTYDCENENPCENQGQCFRDDPNCPRSFMCICNECSHGSRCQFSTKGYGLSLDTILGYYIQPNQPFTKQRLVIHVTTVIITLILIFGFVSNIFSIMTFQTKKAREVGCGYYLLSSSLTSMITIIMFGLKFYFLLVSQMGIIKNRNYLTFNCMFNEYMLKICLSIGDWLNAFVGIERVITVVKYTKFNKMKTKRIANWIIICTYIITAVTYIHDPIYRRLIDDNEEQGEERRTWCHVQFNSSLQLFNSVVLACHFFLPFILNIISALMIIITTARQRSTAQKQKPYKYQLREQFYTLKHLLISPVILITLASSRLVISFLSGCMKTNRGNLWIWIYLSGYLISFLPPMLLFVVFIIPSETYKREFYQTVKRTQRYIRADRG